MLSMDSSFMGVSATTIAMSAGSLLLAACAHMATHWYANRKRRAASEEEANAQDAVVGLRHWIWRGISGEIAPAALLVWVYALHYAVGNVLLEVESATARDVVGLLDRLQGLGVLLGLVWLLARAGNTVNQALRWWAARSDNDWDDALAPFAGRAVRLLLPMMAIILGAPVLAVSPEMKDVIQHAVSMLVVGTLAFLLLQLVNVAATLVLKRHQMDVADNRRARGIYTQVTMLRKIVTTVIVIMAVASMLMVFEPVRHFGTAIIASAGVAGIIVGFAAQKSIATLLAGFQIAMTQPIRIDDVVIVEGEWGQIEEITLTYVVVRIWDWRRLVLPITYFIEKPFQNWTRTSAQIIGSVFLQVDYTVPLEELRKEFQRILEASKLWDKHVSVLQVTDAKEHTVELRALMSAKDASTAWDLRCEVREKLLVYLQRQYPESLPRMRALIEQTEVAEPISSRPAAQMVG